VPRVEENALSKRPLTTRWRPLATTSARDGGSAHPLPRAPTPDPIAPSILAAGALPELDVLGLVVDRLTGTTAWWDYHHVLAHNLGGALIGVGIARGTGGCHK
jgi:hypothetical protein